MGAFPVTSFHDAVAPPPRARQPFHLSRRACVCNVQEPCLVLWRRDAGEGAHLGVGDLTALERTAQQRQTGERLGDAHLLARRTEVDTGSPVEPVSARQKPVVPAALGVELTQHDEQLVGGGVNARGKVRDGLAEVFDRC